MNNRKSESRTSGQTIIVQMCVIFIMLFLCSYNAMAQESDLKLNKAGRAEVIDSVLAAFEIHYVYPEIAGDFCDSIRNKYQTGEYDEIDDLGQLTGRLSNDLRKISGDLHIRVSVMSPEDSTFEQLRNYVYLVYDLFSVLSITLESTTSTRLCRKVT